jgi:molybdopterin-dependent oxidoreductase alpha subunit
MLRVNQEDGVDCPGCAWPEPVRRTLAEFCENGAKAVASEATRKRVDLDFFRRHSVEELLARGDQWLEAQGRLTQPMIRRDGASHFAPISWDEAFALLGRELRALANPDQAIFYTSGRTSNEAAFLFQLFARQYGTNNLPDSSNFCHESSGVGLSGSLGVGKGTVQLSDFEQADAIFVFGQNPGSNHPRMLRTLQDAARRGCRVVAVNPLPELGLLRFDDPQRLRGLLGTADPIATLHLPLRINGDVALIKGMAKETLAAEATRPGHVLDQQFIAQYTTGFEAYRHGLDKISWTEIEDQTSLSRKSIAEAAQIYRDADAVICCWGMGLTHHQNGVANVQELVNLQLLRGNVGRPGAGLCPVRGHSNVQGARTMGISCRPRPAYIDRLARELGFSPPRQAGLDAVQAIRAMHRGTARIFFAMGGNFASAAPDTTFTMEALCRCQLTAHVTTKLNRAQLATGTIGLMLPPLARTERDRQSGRDQFLTVENSMGIIHRTQGRLEPASRALLSEAEIVQRLALATLAEERRAFWRLVTEDYDQIRETIARVIAGVDQLNTRVRQMGGFTQDNAARRREFQTESGKAVFSVHPLPRMPLAPGQFLLMTIRSHNQYNTAIYSDGDRYRGLKRARDSLLINASDLAALGGSSGQAVRVVDATIRAGGMRTPRSLDLRAVPYPIPRGCVAAYFPEANALVPLEPVALWSNTPAYKSVVVVLQLLDLSRDEPTREAVQR